MTLLSHELERSSYSSAHHDLRRTGLTQSQRTTLKNLALCALTLLLSSGALAAVIALRTAIYVSRSISASDGVPAKAQAVHILLSKPGQKTGSRRFEIT